MDMDMDKIVYVILIPLRKLCYRKDDPAMRAI